MIRVMLPLLLLASAAPAHGSASERPPGTVRFATFNIAMGLEREGEMRAHLASGAYPPLQRAAEIIQRVRPDVLLLNEFDHSEDPEAALDFQLNYLSVGWNGQEPIEYRESFTARVNTGEPSGQDLDGDGRIGGPGDSWGYGSFPGQYGMRVLSRFPIDAEGVRLFRHLRWAEMPGALRPVNPDGTPFHDDVTWAQLRLSSKSHWDLPVQADGHTVHFLVSHPTPPVFDGPEDRNGRRNHDEIRFWAEYVSGNTVNWIRDDRGGTGGLPAGASFVIAGDLNADPKDGDSWPGAIAQLLEHRAINAACVPTSEGAVAAALEQGGSNDRHRGHPAGDTADFSDGEVGNLRVDYVLPSQDLEVTGCGVFWPAPDDDAAGLLEDFDHRLVWVDVRIPGGSP